ncbi:hypothetical protein LX36DRAFT_656247 [Colletotrichum falcatum]|nr:hypothetical protein LX36DRAFT_656247 [Colletotrichum falcatum]
MVACSKAGLRHLSAASNLIFPQASSGQVKKKKDTSSASFRQYLDIRTTTTPLITPTEWSTEERKGPSTPFSIHHVTLA